MDDSNFVDKSRQIQAESIEAILTAGTRRYQILTSEVTTFHQQIRITAIEHDREVTVEHVEMDLFRVTVKDCVENKIFLSKHTPSVSEATALFLDTIPVVRIGFNRGGEEVELRARFDPQPKEEGPRNAAEWANAYAERLEKQVQFYGNAAVALRKSIAAGDYSK